MKIIDVVLPVYNEKENIESICQAILQVFDKSLANYDCKILLIDNCSTDGTRNLIENICKEQKRVRAIFNARNFGPVRSPFYGLINTDADCSIQMAADFQDPPEMITEFVDKWEEGNKVVIAIKKTSKENPVMFFIRSRYYGLLKKIADIEHIEHFTGYGLYDRCVVDALRNIKDPYPYLRGLISEIGFKRAEIVFDQPRREKGITKTNFFSLYEYAMLGITSYSKILLRVSTMLGFVVSFLCILVSVVYFVLKLIYWDNFPMGSAPIVIGVFFVGAVQMFFIGLLGEYVLSINTRVLQRPLVVEEKRINFEADADNRSVGTQLDVNTQK